MERPVDPAFPQDAPLDRLYRFMAQGVEIELPRALLQPDLWDALTRGSYEAEELSALRVAVRPNDTVLELGAGVGFISTHLLKHLHVGKLVAMEADPRLIPVIHRTHALNGVSAEVVNAMAARTCGTAAFFVKPSFWASSSVALPGAEEVGVSAQDIQPLVHVLQPDVIVADIQGGEATIFEGLELPTVRHLVVEVHEPEIGLSGIGRCIANLYQAGFTYDPRGSSGTNIVFSRMKAPRP